MFRAPCGDPVPRVLTTSIARDLGYSTKQVRTELRRDRWQQLVRGVYLTRADKPTRADWIATGMALAGRAAALSGWDAVRAYGVGSERAPVDEVLILAPAGTHRLAGRVRIRPSERPLDAKRVGIWSTAPPARAVADTSLVYRTFTPVRALVTAAVQRRLCTPEQLDAELEAGPQNGSAHLRRALQDVFGGVESISEAELADLVRRAGLPEPEYNVPIVTADGVLVANADALWRSLRAALEVDSKQHHFYGDRWLATMRRHNRLSAHQLAITHYPPVDLLNHAERVVPEIEAWLRGRAAELGVPYPPPAPAVAEAGRPRLHVPFVLPAVAIPA